MFDEDADGIHYRHHAEFYIKGQPWILMLGYTIPKNSSLIDLRLIVSRRKPR